MIRLIAGKYGPKLLGPSTILNLDSETEKRLVQNKVAVYTENLDNETQDGNSGTSKSYKTVKELNKVRSKQELIQYAESIGLHELNESYSKASLIDAIANYIEENFGQE